MNHSLFFVRVYGIFIDPYLGVFVSDEIIRGKNITKFPGGGLEYGEGTKECLKREMMEETGVEFVVTSHYYTTDYFVESAFDPGKQVVSIYYLMKPVDSLSIRIADTQFQFQEIIDGAQSFRFIPLNEIGADHFTLTIDRRVAEMLSTKNK